MAALGTQMLVRIRINLLFDRTLAGIRFLSATPNVVSRRRKKESASEKAKNIEIQKNYLQSVKTVVAKFRAERLAEEERKAAAESEQQKLLQQERQLEKRIIKDLNLENELLEKKREERLLKNEARKMRKEEQRLKNILLRQEQLQKERTKIVLKAIEESVNFVTPENLEEKITECLENETNYNFALTPGGERIYSTKPPGNVSTHVYGPGPAAYMFTPLSKDWVEFNNKNENKETKAKEENKNKNRKGD